MFPNVGKHMGEQTFSKRGGRYYVRMRIPSDLKLYFSQRREIRVSLNTNNRAIAKRLVAEKSAELLKEIVGVRNVESHARRSRCPPAIGRTRDSTQCPKS